MDITLKEITSHYGILSVTLNQSDYKESVEKQLRHQISRTQLKGFRKGTAPSHLVNKIYGSAILWQEIQRLASQALGDYIKSQNWYTISDPIVVGMPDKDRLEETTFTFDYEIGFIKSLDFKFQDKDPITSITIDRVEDEYIDNFVSELRIIYGKHQESLKSNDGDLLYGYISMPGEQGIIKCRIAIDKVPENLRKEALGLQANDDITLVGGFLDNHTSTLLDINFKEWLFLKEQQQRAIDLIFTIEKIYTIEPVCSPELLFDKTFGQDTVKSEEQFREKIIQLVIRNKQLDAQFIGQQDAIDSLLKHHPLDIPETFLKKIIGIHLPQLTSQDVESYYRMHAKDMLWNVLATYIIQSNQLTIEQQDILDRAKQMVISHLQGSPLGLTTQDDRLITESAMNFLKYNRGENFMVVRNTLLKEKAADFIKSNMPCVEKSMSVQAFDEMLNNKYHQV